MLHIPVDAGAMTCKVPVGPGVTLPLSPFFGVMGVAPPPAWGRLSTKEPRAHGGNLDNKELGEGAVLWLPVHAPGALFSAGRRAWRAGRWRGLHQRARDVPDRAFPPDGREGRRRGRPRAALPRGGDRRRTTSRWGCTRTSTSR
jgi:hypothetical protein